MVHVEPARLHELANGTRWRAGLLEAYAPLATPDREDIRTHPDKCETYTRAQETMQALDKVIRYHADRMRTVAQDLDKAADTFVDQDSQTAMSIDRLNPR